VNVKNTECALRCFKVRAYCGATVSRHLAVGQRRKLGDAVGGRQINLVAGLETSRSAKLPHGGLAVSDGREMKDARGKHLAGVRPFAALLSFNSFPAVYQCDIAAAQFTLRTSWGESILMYPNTAIAATCSQTSGCAL
jgi:hypothetical protein